MRTTTDRFSLVDKIRKNTPQNNRKYILESVNNTLNDPQVKERIALGEMFGYFGHGRRAMNYDMTGSLNLPETSVVMVDGKPVIIDNVPSNRTLSISMDDSGIVTHTQEILDTPTGQIVDGMEKASAGGWSWATGGDDQPMRSFVSSYHGMDYVNNPNYISLSKSGMMFESAESRMTATVKQLQQSGFSESAAEDIASHFERLNELEPARLAERNAMLESALAREEIRCRKATDSKRTAQRQLDAIERNRAERQAAMLEAVSNMPLFLSKEQKEALINMETKEDMMIVAALLESVSQQASKTLPIKDKSRSIVLAPSEKMSDQTTGYMFSLSRK